MELDNVSDVIRAGLAYERSRVEIASYNLAMANVALPPGVASPLQSANIPSLFAQHLGLTVSESQAATERGQEVRLAHEPGHPFADAEGMVRYPKLDAAREMATLVSATRAYESNIRAYNSLRAMTLKAFEIGK
ncbi:MAG: flagellar biosynthesis protein FlgC [Moraxellaceae bacterium]|nr:flagellar biosynthesis protein FlgC [Moraxellaceae bacterium]MDZ4385686.1 flagellar biosynthesis protein FlgC [Moraxellaceae bacterium]